MAKRSIGSLMRKKLSDITNSQPQHTKLPSREENSLETFPTDKDCIEQLLKERVTLIQLLAERNKIIELSGSELQRLRSNIQKLQLQNWNLAQSNSQMLAELNLGRERIKALQHEILCKAAVLKGTNLEVEGKVEMKDENYIPVSQAGEERAAQPSPRASNEEKHCNRNRRRNMRSRSTGSSKDASKEKAEYKRPRLRRHSARFTTHEHEALENLFEIEDAKYPVSLSSPSVRDETGENSGLRNEGPRSSFGRPLRKAVVKVQSYKEIPLKVKLRRVE